jgi:glycosyltransferase involved in cell wall biosynthesis
MPKVSVIIPAYNAEQFIEKCLISLKQQTFKNFEIIVVDDCSEDGTYKIASQYAHVIRNEKNLGEGESRNVGARASTGEILVFTDADVVAPPDWLQNSVDTMANLDLKCVGGGYCGSIGNHFMQDYAYHELEFRRANIGGYVNTLVTNNFACYRDIFFEYGGFPSDGYKCEDLRLSYKISRDHKIFWDTNNGVYHHFRKDIRGYLRQQFLYSRDTVVSYYRLPKLILAKTHQGRSIYLETILMLLFLASILLSFFVATTFLISLALFLSILLLNLNFLKYLRSKGKPAIKSFALILLRDLYSVAGIVFGFLICSRNLLSSSKVQSMKFTKTL